jgi:hypothetical protein
MEINVPVFNEIAVSNWFDSNASFFRTAPWIRSVAPTGLGDFLVRFSQGCVRFRGLALG